jgi:predicted secreted Zn-dependent protease
MIPRSSWVKRVVLADPERSRRTLRHEQTHFDLSELHARRMRKHFAELFDPCGGADNRLRSAAERFVQEEAGAQERYDQDTRHGLLDVPQARWDREVFDMLAALRQYENSRPTPDTGPGAAR